MTLTYAFILANLMVLGVIVWWLIPQGYERAKNQDLRQPPPDIY